MKWTKIEDEMPKGGYLLLTVIGKSGNKYSCNGSVDSDGNWQDENGYYFKSSDPKAKITHWMPFPTPAED